MTGGCSAGQVELNSGGILAAVTAEGNSAPYHNKGARLAFYAHIADVLQDERMVGDVQRSLK